MKLISPQNLGRRQQCIVTGRTKDSDGFITTGALVKDADGWDLDVILSAAVVREAARLLGMYDAEDVAELKDRVETLGSDLADALERLDDLTQLNELTQKVTA